MTTELECLIEGLRHRVGVQVHCPAGAEQLILDLAGLLFGPHLGVQFGLLPLHAVGGIFNPVAQSEDCFFDLRGNHITNSTEVSPLRPDLIHHYLKEALVGVVGVMNLFIEKSNEFSQEQVDQISELVNHVALVLESSHSKKALEESERRFHDVLDNINLVAVNLDVSGNITYCNDYLLELTGWNRKDVLGQNWADVFLASDQKDDFKDMFFENIQSGNIPAHYEEADILTRQRERRLIFWNNPLLLQFDCFVQLTQNPYKKAL